MSMRPPLPAALVDRSNEAGGQQSASPFNLSDTNFPLGFHLAEHYGRHARKPRPFGSTKARASVPIRGGERSCHASHSLL